MRSFSRALVALSITASAAASQQTVDSVYSARIRELTPTDPRWKFTTELVTTLPASSTVPTPLKVVGYVPGTIGKLSHVADINKYFRALDEASPRAKLFSMGMSDEGREMIALAIADEATIQNLDRYRTDLAKLADPRSLSSAERARLIKEAKPIYWLSGSIHSPETGSPEMLMELAYRLIVDEGDFIRSIRNNEITLITPVTEVDGRDRMVDADRLARELKLGPGGVPLIYWGKYTAHDNNRDAIVLSQKLTQNVINGFLYWKPVVLHDLHESVPFLYTSTGTGPYNDEYDPIVIDEWHTLAYQEITELTRRGLPGVWTHSFYDGWAPNYTLLSVANLHNSIGRFYETYTSRGADCHTVRLPATSTSRTWDRPNPPVNGVKWCIRSNINYQQSGALIALKYVADHKETFLENYVAKAERMIDRGRTSAPYAFVIPHDQRHAAEAADLVNLFRRHGAEVHIATGNFPIRVDAASSVTYVDTTRVPVARGVPADSARIAARGDSLRRALSREPMPPTARIDSTRRNTGAMVYKGDWIVRLDQPYAAPVRTLLAIQKYKPEDPPPYDDTGWTLDELRHVRTIKVSDSTILKQPMEMLTRDATVTGIVPESSTLLVRHLGDWRSAVLPWKATGAKIRIADSAFTADSKRYAAGTYIVENATPAVRSAIAALGLDAVAPTSRIDVKAHGINLPRIALMHSWLETQNEGWVRFAFEQMGIPFTYISDQDLRKPNTLDRFDVVMFEHVSGPLTSLINGRPMIGPAIPWKKTALTPNLGKWDETDDIRPGMGYEGLAALRRFVERGGLLITTGNSSNVPISMGFTTAVSVNTTSQLNARGGIYRAQPVATASPVLYGYESRSFPIYFNQAPVMSVTPRDTTAENAGIDPAIVKAREDQRAKVILRYHNTADSLLVSGLLAGGQELAGRAAVVDAPVGKGHVILFGIRPLWRWESQGSFAMPLNAIVNWNHLEF